MNLESMHVVERSGRIGRLRAWMMRRTGVPLGRWGEWVALRHLLYKRFDIIVRNWTTRQGELDVVAFDGDDLVFIEVRTRKAPTLFSPERSIDDQKRNQLERLAYSFVERYELFDLPLRFDLIAVETPNYRDYSLTHYSGFM